MHVMHADHSGTMTARLRHIPKARLGRGMLAVALVAWGSARACGVPLEDVPIGTSRLNVESAEFVGEGTEVTYLVLDFRAAGGGSFAFGYRHDGLDTGFDMLESFTAAGVLEVLYEEFFGPAVRGLVYPREEQSDVFPAAFDGPRSWILWNGNHADDRVEWSTAEVGLNGIEFGNTEPTVFLPSGGFYGLSTWPTDDFFGAPSPLLPVPGDVNSDGVVDGDDLLDTLLGQGITAGPTLAAGDADRDGDVDRQDVLLWHENAGAGPGTMITSHGVPEPSCLMLAATGLLLLWIGRSGARARYSPAPPAASASSRLM